MAPHPSDMDDRERHAFALFAGVSRRMPSSRFQARLIAAARAEWPAEARRWAGVRSDLVISAGVLGGAAMLTLAPVALVIGALMVDAGVVVKGLARGCVLLVEWLSAGLSLWDVTARAAVAAGTAVSSPIGTAMLIGGVLTASLALAGLSRVLPGEQGEM